MEYQDCINFEQTEQGSDVLTILVTIFILLISIINIECIKD
jgi:hypothetical protein